MSDLVSADEIEQLVGIARHPTQHFARAVSSAQRVYILHSARCLASGRDLRECLFSLALDNGIDLAVWEDHQDRAVRVTIINRRLVPAGHGIVFTPEEGPTG